MSSTSSSAAAKATVVKDAAWAAAQWPVCNNITIHGPNSKQKPPSAIRTAAQVGNDPGNEMSKYQEGVTWLCLAIIGVAMIPGLVRRFRSYSPTKMNTLLAGTVAGKSYLFLVALFRSIGYGSCSIPLFGGRRWRLPALNHTLVITSFSVATMVWCLAIKPYYRCTREWGAPVLGLRASFFANALFPFLFALGNKVNLVTLVTNISYERLQVYHQWTARLILIFAVIHILPWIIQPLVDEGPANLHRYWYDTGSDYYWTGTACITLMVWIVCSSMGVFRKMNYELFILQHIISILLFIGFYFKHTDNNQNSWAWIWASVAIWALGVLLRIVRGAIGSRFFVKSVANIDIQQQDFLPTEKANLKVEPGADNLVRISMSTKVRWSPGQHIFMHFPTFGFMQPHPFTIVSLPDPERKNADVKTVLIARVRSGVTRQLYENVHKRLEQDGSKQTTAAPSIIDDSKDLEESMSRAPSASSLPLSASMTVPASIDGPYGTNASLASYDGALLVAAGSGFSFGISILQDLAYRAQSSTPSLSTKYVKLIWTIRTPATLMWFQQQLEIILSTLIEKGITVDAQIYFTRMSDMAKLPAVQGCTIHRGRPNIHTACKDGIDEMQKANIQSIAMAVCAPLEVADPVQVVAHQTQRKILRNRLGSVREVYLIKESFDW